MAILLPPSFLASLQSLYVPHADGTADALPTSFASYVLLSRQ